MYDMFTFTSYVNIILEWNWMDIFVPVARLSYGSKPFSLIKRKVYIKLYEENFCLSAFVNE